MKALTHYRSAALRVAVTVLFLSAGISAFVSASSLPTAGHTGQALALQASLRRSPSGSLLPNPNRDLLPSGRFKSSLAAMQAMAMRPMSGLRPHAATSAAVTINEAVQTFDLFAPRDNNFAPANGPLTPTNLTPVWTNDQNFIIFASNLAGDGHTHLFAISSNGDLTGQTSSLRQITKGTGDEMFPALNVSNTALAFTSTAGSSNGTSNLYTIPFNIQAFTGNANAIDPSALNSLTGRPDLTSGTGFGAVGRPTWSADGTRIAFAAIDNAGANSGKSHIWYLFTSTNGYRNGSAVTVDNPPAKLTNGPANDTDPAWSPDGNYIAFASTATRISTTTTQVTPTTAATTTVGNQSVRNLFLISGGTTQSRAPFGTVPTMSPNSTFDGHVTNSTTLDDFGPAWSSNQSIPAQSSQYLNPTSLYEYLAWGRGASQSGPHDIYYLRLTELSNNIAVIAAEGQTTVDGETNAVVKLNTDDNAGETSTNGNVYNDVYPTWSPFISVFSVAYSSTRSITYNDPTTNVPLETAVSLPEGSNGLNPVGASYVGILQSQVLNLDPPLLLPFGGGDIVRVVNSSGVTTRNIQPGETATFTVRLSNREAGTDPNNVYIQIKDPNSKYQDAQSLEHKVFTKDAQSYQENPDSYPYPGFGIGTASLFLFNGGLGDGFNVLNNVHVAQRGAIAGVDGSDTISVGTSTQTDPMTGQLVVDNFTSPSAVNDTQYIPFGQEYECQVVNPAVANPNTGTGDFTTPYYVAGIDDATAFSGVDANFPEFSHLPQPTATTAATTADARWIKLTPTLDSNGKPKADTGGGVLYTGTYTTPSVFGSDFYMDVIAYDNAAFPALPLDTSGYTGESKNWRIYDNVGGFSTTPFDGSNDILVVSDNTLGQKFAAGTFGGRSGSSNLLPVFYGAESYFTDIDVSLLPNCVYFSSSPPKAGVPPTIPSPTSNPFPTSFSATPDNGFVTLVWAGVTPAPTGGYNIYRSTSSNITAFGGANSPDFLVNVSGTAATTYVDRAVQNGTTYYYEITAVNGVNNESIPARNPNTGVLQEPSATPFVPGTTPIAQVQGLTPYVGNVLNGLGVGSYDDGQIDDGRTVDGRPAVQSQRYSIWRILSRGPVPASVLQAYAPTFVKQPAVADPVTGLKAVAADGSASPLVPVANRCVIWASPYTGDLLVGAGSILDSSTQTLLKAFVQGGTIGTTTFSGGGRLFVSGQDVASAITQDGSVNNSAANGDFLPSVLNATLATPDNGTQVLTGGAAAGNRVSYDAFFNANPNAGIDQNFGVLNSNLTVTYLAPAQSPVFELGNNYFDVTGQALLERTDSSLDQIGPQIFNIAASVVQGQIDTIAAQNGAHTDINFSGPGAPGLVYNENSTTGGRTAYASFGLEALGIEYYKVVNNNTNYYSPRNLRPNILHNIVCYLRTGSFSGTIRQTGQGGAGVSGATVYLAASGGATIPGNPTARQLYSATTDSSGNYLISGVEPGAYAVVAYKNGYNRATTDSTRVVYDVEGDNSTVVNLNINPVPGGTFSGKVTDGTNGIASANVTFVSADGQTTLTAVTDAGGNYTIVNVPPGSYNGSASKAPAFGAAPPTPGGNPVTVKSGATTTANFVLAAAPGTVSGTVTSAATGLGINNATVTFTPSTGSAALTATTKADGTYTISIPGAGYTAVASATGYITSTSVAFTLAPGGTVTENFSLQVAPKPAPGTLGGLVADSFNNRAVGGATVTLTTSTGATVTDINGNTVGTLTTSATTTSPGVPTGDGSPQNFAFTNLPAGTYTVSVTASGFSSQTLANLVVTAGAFTRADFTSANGNPLQPIHVFNAGYNFFSVPYDYSAAGVGIDDVLGTLNTGTRAAPSAGSNRSHLFVWSPVLVQYLLDPAPPADGLHLGQGYWVYLNGPTEVTKTGNLPTTVTIPVALHRGWNQIGVPSLSPISISRLSFSNATGGGAITFAQASSATYHLVSGTLYGYNGASYVALGSGGTLQTWQSYWIYAFADTTVLIPTGGG